MVVIDARMAHKRHIRSMVLLCAIVKRKIVPRQKKSSEPKSAYCVRARARRLELGMTAEKLGEPIGWTPQQVYRMERGKLPRDEWRLIAIADVLNVSLDWLFGRRDEY